MTRALGSPIHGLGPHRCTYTQPFFLQEVRMNSHSCPTAKQTHSQPLSQQQLDPKKLSQALLCPQNPLIAHPLQKPKQRSPSTCHKGQQTWAILDESWLPWRALHGQPYFFELAGDPVRVPPMIAAVAGSNCCFAGVNVLLHDRNQCSQPQQIQ